MQNFGIKIDLQKLRNAFLRVFKGKTATKRCIVIPIDDNPAIFLGEKGCYLNLTAIELVNPQYKTLTVSVEISLTRYSKK